MPKYSKIEDDNQEFCRLIMKEMAVNSYDSNGVERKKERINQNS